jgi:hypothetical protein
MSPQKPNGKINSHSIFLVTLLLASIFCLANQHPALAQTNSNQNPPQLQEANVAVGQAFHQVLEAEESGANVTVMLNQLSDAADQLVQAENSFQTGNTSSALTQAKAIFPMTQQVMAEAKNAEHNSLAARQNNLVQTLLLSVIAALVFALSLLFIWHLLKRRCNFS